MFEYIFYTNLKTVLLEEHVFGFGANGLNWMLAARTLAHVLTWPFQPYCVDIHTQNKVLGTLNIKVCALKHQN